MKIFTKENKIATAILVGSIILGGFYYVSQLNKQKSIEKQQENQLIQGQEERCQKFANQENIDMNKENSYDLFFSFEYHYNSNTKMCILAYIENALLGFGSDYVIMDLFTNKKIYFKRGLEPGEEATRQYNQFKHTADLYFYQKEVRMLPEID